MDASYYREQRHRAMARAAELEFLMLNYRSSDEFPEWNEEYDEQQSQMDYYNRMLKSSVEATGRQRRSYQAQVHNASPSRNAFARLPDDVGSYVFTFLEVLPLVRMGSFTSQRFRTLIKMSFQSPRVVFDFPLMAHMFTEHDNDAPASSTSGRGSSSDAPPRFPRSTRRAAHYLKNFSNVRAILNSVPYHTFAKDKRMFSNFSEYDDDHYETRYAAGIVADLPSLSTKVIADAPQGSSRTVSHRAALRSSLARCAVVHKADILSPAVAWKSLELLTINRNASDAVRRVDEVWDYPPKPEEFKSCGSEAAKKCERFYPDGNLDWCAWVRALSEWECENRTYRPAVPDVWSFPNLRALCLVGLLAVRAVDTSRLVASCPRLELLQFEKIHDFFVGKENFDEWKAEETFLAPLKQLNLLSELCLSTFGCEPGNIECALHVISDLPTNLKRLSLTLFSESTLYSHYYEDLSPFHDEGAMRERTTTHASHADPPATRIAQLESQSNRMLEAIAKCLPRLEELSSDALVFASPAVVSSFFESCPEVKAFRGPLKTRAALDTTLRVVRPLVESAQLLVLGARGFNALARAFPNLRSLSLVVGRECHVFRSQEGSDSPNPPLSLPSVRALSLTYAKSSDQWYDAHSQNPNSIFAFFPGAVEVTLIGITRNVTPTRADELHAYAGYHSTGWKTTTFKFPPAMKYLSVQQKTRAATALAMLRCLPATTRVVRMQVAFHYDWEYLNSEFKEVVAEADKKGIYLAIEHDHWKLGCRNSEGHDNGRQINTESVQWPSGWFEREFLTV